MLVKVLFNRTIDLYQTKFLQEQHGALVVPKPDLADRWREQLLGVNGSLRVITYADWLKELSRSYINTLHELTSKSDLWDIFHRVWKNCQGPSEFSLFSQAFKLYTELKSFTPDKEIFGNVLDAELKLPQITKESLMELYSIEQIQDEYQLLRQLINIIQNTKDGQNIAGSYHFIGYYVFSPLQIDMFHAAKECMDINIYIPQQLAENSQHSDWPSWLKEDKKIEIKSGELVAMKLQTYSQARISSLWEDLKGKDVTITAEEVELPLLDLGQQAMNWSAQTGANTGSLDIGPFLGLIKNELFLVQNLSWSELLVVVNKKIKSLMRSKKNYPQLKWALYTQKWLVEKNNSISAEEPFTWMDLYILQQKMELDAPRLKWHRHSQQEDTITLRQLGENVYFKPLAASYFIAHQSLLAKRKNVNPYQRKTLAILNSLGPVSNEMWGSMTLDWQVYDCLGQGKIAYLYIDEQLPQQDQFWKKIYGSADKEYKVLKSPQLSEDVIGYDILSSKNMVYADRFSPTAVYTYRQCPRQYYAHHIEKLNLTSDYKSFITESEKGEFYHLLMEKIGQHPSEIKKCLADKAALEDFIKANWKDEIALPPALLEEFKQVFRHSLQTWSLMPFDRTWEIGWEKILDESSIRMKGRIDFIAYNAQTQHLVLIDFKKSRTPTIKSVREHDQWQISCYLQAWHIQNPQRQVRSYVFGYWNLTDVEQSIFFREGEFPFQYPVEFKDMKIDFSSWLASLKEIWDQEVNLLLADKLFLPRPKTPQTCDFCVLDKVCPKGQI